MGVPYKIVDLRSKQRVGVVVSSLRELMAKAQEKFSIKAPVRVVLESDGTQIDDEEYFSTRIPDTCFVILKPNENYKVSFSQSTSEHVSTKENCGDENAEIASETSSNQVFKPVETLFSSSSRYVPVVREVLSRVLKCLPLEDRNSVRLTCRLWNDICCNDPYVYRNEKLVFKPFDDISAVANGLRESKRKLLNVEFHLNQLRSIPGEIWKICGPKLLSITWYKSTVYDGEHEANYDEIWLDCENQAAKNERTILVNDIIRYSTQLEYFGHKLEYWYLGNIMTEAVLNKLLRGKIVRDNMKALSEMFTYADLVNAKKFKVFPKLTEVHVSDFETMGQESKINLSTLPNTVTKLKLVSGAPCSSNCLASLNSRVMLTELIISLKGERDVDRSLFPFFTRQTGLKVVRLQIEEYYVNHKAMGSGAFNTPEEVELFKANLVVHILKSCPKLGVLDINFTYSKELNADTDQRFAQMFGERISKLDCLSLANFDFTKLLPPVLPEQSNLRSLQFPETSSSCVQILKQKMFHNLQFIDLPKCSLAMLKTVSESLVSLRALRIECLNEGQRRPKKETVNQLVGRLKTNPNVSFKELEHLEVYGGSYSMLLVFNQFHFPVLKHFQVSDCEDINWRCEAPINKIAQCLPQRAPHLEILHFDVYTDQWIKGSSDLEFVKLMPKLQIFAFGPKGFSFSPRITFEDWGEIFEMCPSLRIIIHDDAAFFYNRKCEKVIGRGVSMKRAYERTCYSFKKGICCKLLPSRKNENPGYF